MKRAITLALIISGLSLGLASPAMAAADSLLDIYQLAARNAPQIRGALAGLEASRQAIPQSAANFRPQVSAGAAINEHSNDYIDGTQRVFVNLNQNLYNRAYNVQSDSAEASVAQAEADYQSTEQGLILGVAQAYFAVLSAQDNVGFAAAEKEAVGRQLEQTRERFEVGLIPITDVHESQAAYDSAVASEIAALNELNNVREQLREITGRYHENLARLHDSMPLLKPSPADPEQWTATALENNPALLAAQERTRQASLNVDSQGAGNYPTADLSLTFTEAEGGTSEFTSDGLAAQLSLNYSFYDGGRKQANIAQARQLLIQSQEAYEQTRRATERQVRNAYLGVLSNISRVGALNQAVISNQSALEAAEAGYEVGSRTTVDVLLARRNLFAAQRDHTQARYNYVLNTLTLEQAAGTLDIEDLQNLGQWLR